MLVPLEDRFVPIPQKPKFHILVSYSVELLGPKSPVRALESVL